jgi:glycosyltransferase involved in cell wall biosynthesis
MPEVANGSALLVNPRDLYEVAGPLERVATDSGLAAELRIKGLARAAQLSWKSFAEANLNAYRELLPKSAI